MGGGEGGVRGGVKGGDGSGAERESARESTNGKQRVRVLNIINTLFGALVNLYFLHFLSFMFRIFFYAPQGPYMGPCINAKYLKFFRL